MKFELDGDGLRIDIRWKTVKDMSKGLILLIAALFSLLTAPQFVQLGALLGWW